MLNVLCWVLAPPAVVVLLALLAAAGGLATLSGRTMGTLQIRAAANLARESYLIAEFHVPSTSQDALYLPDHWEKE